MHLNSSDRVHRGVVAGGSSLDTFTKLALVVLDQFLVSICEAQAQLVPFNYLGTRIFSLYAKLHMHIPQNQCCLGCEYSYYVHASQAT